MTQLIQLPRLIHYLQVCDLAKLSAIARKFGAIVMVDNSIMTPIYQRPLDLGADISMISATKFVGGHSDVTGGILSVRGKELADRCGRFSVCISQAYACVNT